MHFGTAAKYQEILSVEEMSENCHKPLHIAMFPWFAFGHITSFLHLANKLAERGHKISFILPPKTRAQMLPHNHHPDLISFIPISLPHVDGLPDGAETTADVPASARPLIMTAMDRAHDKIETLLSGLRPDFIFFDFTEWVPCLARKHRVRSVFYATVYVVTVAYLTPQARNLPADGLPEEELASPPPGFPCPDIGLRAHEARFLANASEVKFGGERSLLERAAVAFRECDAMGIKSCREMEGAYCDYVVEHYGKPLLLAGPIVPKVMPDSRLEDYFDSWLKEFSKGSVVYCALGSECFLTKDQFQELVLGLELTGMPFLAALKLPTDCPTMESALPEGFEDRTKGRGMVHGGWVQQHLILNHPSVGYFVTHCGAGSLSEGLVSHCQLVMLPQAVDQFLNARMMSRDLKVGVEVERREEDGSFTREAVREAIMKAMEEESEVGREVKRNHDKMREFLLKEGIEESYISSFIQSLYDLNG